MSASDSFVDLARYYDPIMSHVDYDRWYLIGSAIGGLLPRPFTHLDAACGTGVLLKKFQAERWRSIGIDLSPSMLRAGRQSGRAFPAAAADLRALPFKACMNYITCLFDSVNFLLQREDMEKGIGSLGGALAPDGILYFDVVTERMVLEHFAGQSWTERNGKFVTTWECEYDRKTLIAETRIRVNSGPAYTLYERVYEQGEVEAAVTKAGLSLLGTFDAETWRSPRRKTVRIDFVAVNGDPRPLNARFKGVRDHVRALLR
ncbi:MAG: class I SAM-dependent methyltransferase [Candidatus Hydrogenedentes bacterium]|nr:class I SAM-dependent methyltransferase [Candidatus Hydrogenedentota bacterium]